MVSDRSTSYVGRFAPSPSGPLHFGSLVCALASFLDAHANHGQWLVRMEDIDPPREQPGAADRILTCLTAHGLEWDGEVLWQSTRDDAYHHVLEWMAREGLTYPCSCNRQRLKKLGGVYDGFCRKQPPASNVAAALRLKARDLPPAYTQQAPTVEFEDAIQGPQADPVSAQGDFVIHRKDGLFAYQLAVVVDDIFQGITHVVRGSDLLDTTGRQIYLFRLLAAPAPQYAHIPVVVDSKGQKLSKQNHAAPIDPALAVSNLWYACHALGLVPPEAAPAWQVSSLLEWATQNWSLSQVPRALSVNQ